jgi:hypothetical protein
MEAFVTRKKRKSSPEARHEIEAESEESTDVKLAMLSSLHPAFDQETLLDFLLAHDGSVKATSQSLRQSKTPQKSGVVAQMSLRSYSIAPASSNQESNPSKKPKLLSKKGATMHLFDPQDISEHTPCSIVHNFLPPEDANSLLIELLEESKTFEKITFKLFDNVVSSPHTSSFYVGTYDELDQQKHEYVYNGARLTVNKTLFFSPFASGTY